jgi:predicted nucleic acid-binding protein
LGDDFIDCYNAALAEFRGAKMASFDKVYRKFPGLKREVL